MMIHGPYAWCIACILSTYLTRYVFGLVEFSKSFNGSDIITSFQGVTLAKCARKCEVRARCKSAVYYRHAGYCTLTAYERDVEPVVSTVAATLLSGFNPVSQPSLNCGGTVCSTNETCIITSPGSRVCKLKECEKPVVDNIEFFGNRYSVGSKHMDRCGSQITCDESGHWLAIENFAWRDCNDVNGTSGVYTTSGLCVYCDMDTDQGHWLVFQRRQDGTVDFERSWADYRDGFGSPHGEFWLGNELIHQLLSNGEYELRINMEDWYGIKKFAKYSSFSISDEAHNYTLAVSGYSGDDSGNAFSYMNGYMFSTIDVDNDVNGGSCAQSFRGGWWYTSCHNSNLNGLYHVGGNTTVYAKIVVWKTWHGYYYSLKTTEMKMRRK